MPGSQIRGIDSVLKGRSPPEPWSSVTTISARLEPRGGQPRFHNPVPTCGAHLGSSSHHQSSGIDGKPCQWGLGSSPTSKQCPQSCNVSLSMGQKDRAMGSAHLAHPLKYMYQTLLYDIHLAMNQFCREMRYAE
ncbi:hypothetical protein CCM_05151 [Cordyceps militaris CM01]|uniref:Uncharacterized protein n=1 Tax=Cordyceps militaris (strain CM01) TaxID=983644 RepID=G3JI41_CORMM|nr:uncharacterized protein CCM_05151 [Cordyceps militaris CM01]EGX90994.1 hypothetical protein CCM_05151 [Cordyceps militaris CM01]